MSPMTTLGPRAKGTFGPAGAQMLNAQSLGAIQGGRFLVPALQTFIGSCGDERLDVDGTRLLIPPVFGGFFCTVLADALTTRTWYKPGDTAEQHALRMIDALADVLPAATTFCVHTDAHAVEGHAEECGCAAIAKAPAVLNLLLEYQDLIDKRYREQIVENTRELLGNGYFQAGTAGLVDKLEAAGVRKEILAGGHDGLAAVILEREGMVSDRPAFYRWCDEQGLPRVPFFEYARWSMRATAEMIAPSQADFFFAAGDAFNIVVPYAICNKEMVVITIE